jgi:DNA-binding NarL/FixJ family response regulator
MRKAINSFLEDRSDILLVGEAENFDEAVVKAKQLRADVKVFDLHLCEKCENVQSHTARPFSRVGAAMKTAQTP